MRFVIFRRMTIRGKRWFWHLKSANHEIIAQGEGYHNKEDCRAAVSRVQDTNMTTHVEWKAE